VKVEEQDRAEGRESLVECAPQRRVEGSMVGGHQGRVIARRVGRRVDRRAQGRGAGVATTMVTPSRGRKSYTSGRYQSVLRSQLRCSGMNSEAMAGGT